MYFTQTLFVEMFRYQIVKGQMQLIIFLIINTCIAIYVAFVSSKRINARGGKSILALSLGLLLCSGIYLLYSASLLTIAETVRTSIVFFSMAFAATAVFSFSLEYTYQSQWINKYTLLMSVLGLLVTQILFWFPEIIIPFLHPDSLSEILDVFALPEKINLLYRFSFITVSLWILGRSNLSRSGDFSIQHLTLLIGPLIAFFSFGLAILGFHGGWLENLSLISLNLCALGFVYNTFYHKASADIPISRESVVENMEDGWIVLNAQNLIVDLNRATVDLIDMPQKDMYGKSITSIFSDFPNLVYTLDSSQEIEMDGSIKVNGEYRYLNIRVSNLRNDTNTAIGRLVLWRDITDRKRADDARQQARNEMFVLLNAISSTASQATTLQEFLSDAIYQIIYPFRSQVVLIYIHDERENLGNEREFYLTAQLGLNADSAKVLSKLPTSSSLFTWNDQNRQYLLLDDSQDNHVPKSIKTLEMSCLLTLPLTVQAGTEKKLIGSLILGRKENPTFKQDEIIRLTILADQIATLIDSDRRRKLAISLLERQRLMRDIHDSVSQKLYGLVTITEAALAGIEADVEVDYSQVLSRISENARQAVKELRLFLFQMMPIDLEKDGLVSVLHHRLAAVEGRADIKVKFLADEPIALSKRKEVAIYYIAQEALNNILRHAHAKSVTMTLKQGYKYVTFEIADDGCGFESDKLNKGGLGLQNIKERVKQENGKLKILSKPDKGTIIKVTFEKDFLSTYKNN